MRNRSWSTWSDMVKNVLAVPGQEWGMLGGYPAKFAGMIEGYFGAGGSIDFW